MSDEAPYIRIIRLPSTRAAMRPDGTVPASIQRADRFSLLVPDDFAIETVRGLSVATHTERHAAPVLVAGWYPDALCPGMHRGDPALRFEGYTPPRYDRSGVIRQDYESGILIHDFNARSDGCPTAPQPWVDAVIAYLDRLAEGGAWNPRRHKDGRWCVSLQVVEPT